MTNMSYGQVIPVIPLSQVIPLIPVNQVIIVIPVGQVSPVSPVRLAHLWVDFRVIFVHLNVHDILLG